MLLQHTHKHSFTHARAHTHTHTNTQFHTYAMRLTAAGSSLRVLWGYQLRWLLALQGPGGVPDRADRVCLLPGGAGHAWRPCVLCIESHQAKFCGTYVFVCVWLCVCVCVNVCMIEWLKKLMNLLWGFYTEQLCHYASIHRPWGCYPL